MQELPEVVDVPWARRPDEKDWEYGEFVAWLELPRPQRDFTAFARRLQNIRADLGVRPDIAGTSRMYVARQAQRFDWSARVQAFDEARYAKPPEQEALDRSEMNVRHAASADKMINALMRPIQAWLERIGDLEAQGIDWTRSIPVEDLFEMVVKSSRALPNLVKAERLARGESTETVLIDVEARLRRLARERGLNPDEVLDAARRTWRPGGEDAIPGADYYIKGTQEPAQRNVDPMSVYFPLLAMNATLEREDAAEAREDAGEEQEGGNQSDAP